MLTATTTTRLEKTIAEILEYRDSLAMDLATMPGWKQGTAWALDRQRELIGCNVRLKLLGYLPADAAC